MTDRARQESRAALAVESKRSRHFELRERRGIRTSSSMRIWVRPD